MPEVIDVQGHEWIPVGDGETFENVLFDQRGDGNHATLDARGSSGFTIRNVGWLGGGRSDAFQQGGMNIFFSVPDGGEGVIENVFMASYESWDEIGGIQATGNHAGDCYVRNSTFAGFGNNSTYCSSQGRYHHQNGRVHFESCYSRDSTGGGFRIGGEGSSIRNCVAFCHDPDGVRPPYPPNKSEFWPRPIQLLRRDCTVENTSVYLSSDDYGYVTNDNAPAGFDCFSAFSSDDVYHPTYTIRNVGLGGVARIATHEYNGGTVTLRTENVHSNPTVDVLQNGGVPLSPEMAANGERAMPPEIGTDPAPPTWDPQDSPSREPVDPNVDPETANEFAFLTPADAPLLDYEFEATGRVAYWSADRDTPSGNPIESGGNDQIYRRSDGMFEVEGSVGSGYGDAYLIEQGADVTSFQAYNASTGDETVTGWLEGNAEHVAPDDLPWPGDGDDDGDGDESVTPALLPLAGLVLWAARRR